MIADAAVRLAVDLAKRLRADAQRDFEITVREIALKNAPPDGPWLLDVDTYSWRRPSSASSGGV